MAVVGCAGATGSGSPQPESKGDSTFVAAAGVAAGLKVLLGLVWVGTGGWVDAGPGSGEAQALFEPHGSMLFRLPKPDIAEACGAGVGFGGDNGGGCDRLKAEF